MQCVEYFREKLLTVLLFLSGVEFMEKTLKYRLSIYYFSCKHTLRFYLLIWVKETTKEGKLA